MKRVLFVSTGVPKPGSGTGERSMSICNALARIAKVHSLTVFAGGQMPDISGQEDHHVVPLFGEREDTQWYWRRRKYLLRDYRVDERVFQAVRELHERHRYDAFFCRYFTTAVSGCERLAPTVFDFDDVPGCMPGPAIPLWKQLGWALTNKRLRHYHTVFVTKSSDRVNIRHPDVRVLPCISTLAPASAIELDRQVAHRSARKPSQRMLFVGSWRWPPNRQGLEHFISASLPEIRKQVPTALLRVVGEDTQTIRGDGVQGVGFVPDLMSEYAASDVVICPMQAGCGANVKLAEAASLGMAIVATPKSAAGFDGFLVPGRDLLVADSDQQMTSMCVRLLQDNEARDRLGTSARRTSDAHLSQAAIDKVIADALPYLS